MPLVAHAPLHSTGHNLVLDAVPHIKVGGQLLQQQQQYWGYGCTGGLATAAAAAAAGPAAAGLAAAERDALEEGYRQRRHWQRQGGGRRLFK